MGDFFSLLLTTIYFCVGIIIVLWGKNRFGTTRTPLNFFCLVWCIVGGVANIGLYDFYKPVLLVNTTIIFGIVIFALTFSASASVHASSKCFDRRDFEFKNINFKLIYITNIICIGFLLPFLERALSIIAENNFAYLRAFGGDTDVGISTAGWQNTVIDSFIRPVFMTTAILATVMLFSNARKRRKTCMLIFAVSGNLMLSMCTAARGPIVNFLFYFLFAFLIFRGKNIIKGIWKEKGKILFAVFLVFVILYITDERSGGKSSLEYNIKQFYSYYFSGPVYLSRLLEVYTDYGIGGKMLFGSATFGFITNWISFVLIFITGRPQGSLWLLGSVITNRELYIGTSTKLNAMCTGFYPFLLDWGYLGMIIGPVLMGYASAKIYNRVNRKNDAWSYSLYIYWIYVLFRTVFKWDLVNVDFGVFLLCMYVSNLRFKGRVKFRWK